MIKFTSNNDFDFQCESVSLITDVSKSLTKRAAAKDLLKYEKTPNQEDLHIIAVGAYEGTGSNRNGDCFLEDDCKKNHHYFTKSNRAVHRHHKNKPNDPKFGNIKAAAYNDKMRRIELIVGLDKDKCGDILHEQETTGNTNWSMASKQAKDVCSWCGHEAKTDKDRCTHIPGQIGEINKQGEMCSMINPDPRWFEISYVRRPADRIGMSLSKLASDVCYKPMTSQDYLNLYGDLYIPEDVILSKKASDKRELLFKLAGLEKHIDAVSNSEPINSKDKYIKRHGAKLKCCEPMGDDTIESLRKLEPAAVLRALADHGIIFSPEDFSKYLFDKKVKPERVAAMKSHLPGIYGKLKDNDNGKATNSELYEPDGLAKLPAELRNLVSKLTESHSLNEGPAVRRIMMISISGGPISRREEPTKEAADLEFAKQYAIYKLAALNYINDQGKLTDDLLLNAVLQQQ